MQTLHNKVFGLFLNIQYCLLQFVKAFKKIMKEEKLKTFI